MLVNNYLQESSQMTQKVFHNYTMSVIQETKSLADFVRNVMEEKHLTSREVETRSGNTITHSYVNKIKNGDAKNPSTPLIQALAKGLGEPEEIIFALVRGKIADKEKIVDEKFENLGLRFSGLPASKKEKAQALIDLMDRELERLANEK